MRVLDSYISTLINAIPGTTVSIRRPLIAIPCANTVAFIGALLLLFTPTVFATIEKPLNNKFAAQTDLTAHEWLLKMSHAFRELNYKGIFTYERGNHLEALEITHLIEDGIQRERLYHLNGAPREVIRHGHSIDYMYAGDQILRQGSIKQKKAASKKIGPFSVATPSAMANLTDYYRLALKEQTRIADRRSIQISVEPIDIYRYGYDLWLDAETGLLLKSSLISPDQRVLERFQFVQVEIGDDLEDTQILPKQASHYQPKQHTLLNNEAQLEADVPIEVNWTPKGFRMSSHQQNSAHNNSPEPYVLMYTDGLAVFSVFIESDVAADTAVGVVRHGATVAFATLVAQNNDQHLVTVVGEIPLATAERVAQSVVVR